MREYYSVQFSDVKVTGKFWRERLETILTRTIPSQLKMLAESDIRGSIKLPKPVPEITQPRRCDGFTVQMFWDSDIGKWIEAASYALSHRRDPVIECEIEEIIDDLEAAQAEDGYLNCWYLQREPENKWTNLRDNHELYNAGHLLEGAVAYFQSTGRDRFLNIMERYVDHIKSVFGPNKKRGYPGHQEIEIALIRAFHATKKQKFIELASYFINERGNTNGISHYFDIEASKRGDERKNYFHQTYEYNQSHLPVRSQKKVVGHAVRAMYMYSAMADLAADTNDNALKEACETLWSDVTKRRMYVTGAFGPSSDNEGFTKDYDLPNDTSYAETCASVAMIFWASRMLNLDLDAKYADVLERCLFNNTLAGLSLDGESYFYDNKLESDGTHSRWRWHSCPCCTMNVSRLIASVASYFTSKSKDEFVFHLYGGVETTVSLSGVNVLIKETSNYPWNGDITIHVEPETHCEFLLSLRIPYWCSSAKVTVNGEDCESSIERGYFKIHRNWKIGDEVKLYLKMEPQRIYSNPNVNENLGRVALQCGPLIYCIEQNDHQDGLDMIRISPEAKLRLEVKDGDLGMVNLIKTTGSAIDTSDWSSELYRNKKHNEVSVNVTAVPYYLWCNRGPNKMKVWIRE